MSAKKLLPISFVAASAAAFAFMSYRKDDMVEKILGLRDGLTCKFESREDGALKFGYVVDEITNTLYLVGRGTAGDTRLANAVSWVKYDLRLRTGPDGEHDGFQDAGNQYFEWLKSEEVLEKYHDIATGSHSQGSGYMQRAVLLVSRHYPTRSVDAHLYACPPYFKKGHELELSGFLQSPHSPMHVTRYVQPGDPIDTKFLRDENSGWRNGADIGNEYILPDIAIQKLGPAEAVNHSCRFQCSAMIIDVCKRRHEYNHPNDMADVLDTLSYAWENCIN